MGTGSMRISRGNRKKYEGNMRGGIFMRDAETTIGNLADKQTVAFIGAADEEGFPVVKAMLAPRKREGIKVFYFTTNTSSRHTA